MRDLIQIGGNLKLLINNKTLGIVTGFSYMIDYGRRALRGVDCPFPQEIVSGQQTVRGQVSVVRLKGVTLENCGVISPQLSNTGTATGEMAGDPYFSLTLVDRTSDQTVFRVDAASLTNQQWTVGARGIMTGSFNFEGVVEVQTQS